MRNGVGSARRFAKKGRPLCARLMTPSGSDAVAGRRGPPRRARVRRDDRCRPVFVGRFGNFDGGLAGVAIRPEFPPPDGLLPGMMAAASPEEPDAARREPAEGFTDRARERLAARLAEDFAVGGDWERLW